jgi:hypothetical protein
MLASNPSRNSRPELIADDGRVEDWRGASKVQPIRCSPFPLGVPH